ncbi:MAG: Transposase domain protein, partial [Gemmataceae bacterium]|nr:Transposase domain protein [Gemmataceae bacterium]
TTASAVIPPWGMSPRTNLNGRTTRPTVNFVSTFLGEYQSPGRTGRALDARVNERWRRKGRRVYAYDGSSVSMPDTPRNQRDYPQPGTQKRGLGFPLARSAAVFSLAGGAVLDLGICRYAGKGQGELSLLRTLWGLFAAGDVLLTDRLMCAWTALVLLRARGVVSVTRLSKRRAGFRRGRRLGKDDQIVRRAKPTKPRSIDRRTYDAVPESLMVRETRVRVGQAGFRSRAIVVATTLPDAKEVTEDDLAQLYRARWNAELDSRSLKRTLQMDVLRCKTPELVRKEIRTHVPAYNLVRTIMAQAATERGIEPRSISFRGAVQTLEAFQPVIAMREDHAPEGRVTISRQLLEAIPSHRVADRPDRVAPRLRKRRPKHYGFLRKPRCEAKRDLPKSVREK